MGKSDKKSRPKWFYQSMFCIDFVFNYRELIVSTCCCAFYCYLAFHLVKLSTLLCFVYNSITRVNWEYFLSAFKVNLHSIRFSYVFVRFFTFLLLLDKVCAFSFAFLCVHIRTNQTVTYWTKVFWKKFFVKEYSSISKYRSYRSHTKFLNKIFIYI